MLNCSRKKNFPSVISKLDYRDFLIISEENFYLRVLKILFEDFPFEI